ncbi:MAG: AAA family ATPase [Rhizobiales bacterium]|nr:AAA family ATPase [Hyphomicrobiales bacterium]
MKVIAIAQQKGGAGKTTLAMNLAVAAHERGRRVLILDMDPQQSILRWHELRGRAPDVIATNERDLAAYVAAAAENDVDWLVIDTAPKSEASIRRAAEAADLLLMPCQPSKLDRHAVGDTVETVRATRTPAAFVLNNCIVTSKLVETTVEDLVGNYDVPIAPAALGKRTAFVAALEDNQAVLEYEPRGKAAAEVRALYRFVCKKIGEKP